MPNLFPEGYENETVAPTEIGSKTPIGYKVSAMFDYEKGDFVRNGQNQVLTASGIDTWKAWCTNAVLTERYAYLAYSSDFGVEIEEAMKAETRDKAESLLTRTITESLMADPYQRTHFVKSITYHWDSPDSVEASIVVIGIDNATIDIVTTLKTRSV